MTEAELGEELRQIYKRVGQPLSRDVVGLMDELDDRCQWLARSSELLAEAQAMNDRRRGKESEALGDLPASVARERLADICADESRLLKLADRLNSTIVHQIDAIRTILSFEKSLSQQTPGQRP